MNQQETDQFLSEEDFPATKMNALSFCPYFLLTFRWSSYPGLMLLALTLFPNLAHFAYLFILYSLCADLLAVSSKIMLSSIAEEVCVHACMLTST